MLDRLFMGKDNRALNILIIKPGAVGDLLQLTPVVRALAARFPNARTTVIVGTQATSMLFKYNPAVAEIIVFDQRGEHRSCASILRLWQQVRAGSYDLVINFQRSNLKAWLLVTAALPCRVLVYHKQRSPVIHAVDNYLETIAPLGIVDQDRRLELHPGREAEQYADELFAENGLAGKTVIALNPGATHPVNRWGVNQFAVLADTLVERLGSKIIIIGGKEDVLLVAEIEKTMRAKPFVLTGKTTLLQLGAVLKKCDVLVSGDTGPLHLATAVSTPVVSLFGAADPARTGPVGEGNRVLQARDVTCVPCRSRTCTSAVLQNCMKKISVEDVANAVEELLKRKRDNS
jgi:heptosyltransferase II